MRGLGSGHVTCGPMRGLEKNCMGRGQTDRQTDRQTDGHGDSMTDPAQRAESVKILLLVRFCLLHSTHPTSVSGEFVLEFSILVDLIFTS